MLLQEGAEAFLRIVVFGLAQQVEGIFILRLLDRIAPGSGMVPPVGAVAACAAAVAAAPGAGWTFACCI